ncbi:T9SS type A sorting domain-containing protein [Hymenobacter sp. BRD67]|uniref:T9SS type A sorting domain-containing protein n=1 Tax=Hymenobacter sp. BRD67 TaxID=2675877 RepID=UPI001563BD2B|nr:T9SS type A sorting domain-containing protein [Hymenobacter sp. BRD67]QKG53135.1 T9SS type A sorting domain-containing protein [Hymenobacter sp. BRD67]
MATLYYRLRQLDHDGTAHFSPVVTVAAHPGSSLELHLSPNPALATLTMFTSQPAAYVVRSALGQALLQGLAEAGHTSITVAGLPAGLYFVEAHTDAGLVIRRFVKE